MAFELETFTGFGRGQRGGGTQQQRGQTAVGAHQPPQRAVQRLGPLVQRSGQFGKALAALGVGLWTRDGARQWRLAHGLRCDRISVNGADDPAGTTTAAGLAPSLAAWGMDLAAEHPSLYSDTVSAIRVPQGVDARDVIASGEPADRAFVWDSEPVSESIVQFES